MKEPTLQQKERDIAEWMGYKTRIHPTIGCLIYKDKQWKKWQPSQDAGQCLQVLDWLFKQKGRASTFSAVENQIYNIPVSERKTYIEDFKTAVVLAAWEYIQTKKK